jgi:hypothetical protein
MSEFPEAGGLSRLDALVLQEATRSLFVDVNPSGGRSPIKFAPFAAALLAHSITAEEVNEALIVLEAAGLVKTTRGIGQRHPVHFRVTIAGAEMAIGAVVPEYEEVTRRIADAVVNRRLRRSDEIGTDLAIPLPLVDHVLDVFHANRWVKLSGEVGIKIVVGFDPGLRRRLLSPATDDARSVESATQPLIDPPSDEALAEMLNAPDARVWGRWEAVDTKPIFTSSMSRVWRVRDRSSALSGVFALKELRYPKQPGSTAYERFEREVTTLQKPHLQHPNIVSVVEAAVPAPGTRGSPYLVMPLAQMSLLRACRAMRGNLEWALETCIAVARGLEVAHSANIIHRDVKPANVLLFGEERAPVLCDFGICYLQDEDRLTRNEAQTVGTADFVAPELHGGGQSDAVSPAVDVYSLGKTIYAAVAGGHTFPREWFGREDFDLTKLFPGRRFEHLNGLLERMVTTNPSTRFASMAECRQQLERALANYREGIPFRAGMYGGADTPVERFIALDRLLHSSTPFGRSDAFHDAHRREYRRRAARRRAGSRKGQRG